jgi:shikimate dehydrogenase
MINDVPMAEKFERTYGLIGYPLTHSFSRDFFNQKFASEGIPARYLNFELPDIGDLMEVIAEYPDLAGLNVTIPYKEQVLPYLAEIDDDAREIGAVNVIKFVRKVGNDIRMKGYNSDVIGFSDSIKPYLKAQHTKALILGSGGAAKAVRRGLLNLGVEPVYVSRKPREGAITYADLTPEVMASHKVIVNTTPLGMYPHVDECADIPYDLLTSEHLCYDLIYNPDVTLFLKKSAERGAVTKNGLEMLLLQAFASWRIWEEL